MLISFSLFILRATVIFHILAAVFSPVLYCLSR